MGEIAAIIAEVLFFGGIWIGYWLRGVDVDDLETENCELRDVNKDLRNDLETSKTLAADYSTGAHHWHTKYEELVEAVKKKAAEKPKKAAKKK